jgi:hypothetical protein
MLDHKAPIHSDGRRHFRESGGNPTGHGRGCANSIRQQHKKPSDDQRGAPTLTNTSPLGGGAGGTTTYNLTQVIQQIKEQRTTSHGGD